jgi:hypothetical protein
VDSSDPLLYFLSLFSYYRESKKESRTVQPSMLFAPNAHSAPKLGQRAKGLPHVGQGRKAIMHGAQVLGLEIDVAARHR